MESFNMAESKEKTPYWDMGKRIARAREVLTDMNQSQMTEALGLKEPTYGNYERGTRKMPPHIMQKFSDITGCSANWIYLGKGNMTGGEDKIDSILSEIDDPELRERIRDQVASYTRGIVDAQK